MGREHCGWCYLGVKAYAMPPGDFVVANYGLTAAIAPADLYYLSYRLQLCALSSPMTSAEAWSVAAELPPVSPPPGAGLLMTLVRAARSSCCTTARAASSNPSDHAVIPDSSSVSPPLAAVPCPPQVARSAVLSRLIELGDVRSGGTVQLTIYVVEITARWYPGESRIERH